MSYAGQGRPWTATDVARAWRMWERGFTYADIALVLGRKAKSVEAKIHYERYRGERRIHLENAGASRAPDFVLADRERRQEAKARRDTTAVFFGDPPPGYSALDKRKGEKHGASRQSPSS